MQSTQGLQPSTVALAQSALQPNTSITGGTHAKITYDSKGISYWWS